MNSTWVISKNEVGEKLVDPKSEEKFGEYSSIFEFIQNAIDAKIENKIPLVKINFDSIKKKKFESLITKEFITHLENSPRVKNLSETLNDEEVQTLILEDFNTSGISGEPETWGLKTLDGKDNPIFRFNNCIGVEAKLEDAVLGGSEGEGRQTFCHASEISTFFYHTIRHNELNKPLMMGFAYLGIRHIGNSDYDAIVHFGTKTTSEKGKVYGSPTSDESDISDFKSITNLTREKSQPGSSVVIPYKNDVLNKENIIKQILNNYRIPILRGLVEIQVDNELINASSYEDISKNYIESNTLSLNYLNFVEEISSKNFENGNSFTINFNPLATSLLNQDDIDNFKGLVDKFNSNETIKIKVPFDVHYKKRLPGSMIKKWTKTRTSYSIYAKKFPTGYTQPLKFNDYIRGYLPIFGMQKPLLMYCLIDVQEEEAMQFFKRAEGANHTKWISKHKKLKFYRQGTYSKFVQYTNNLPNYLYDLIAFSQQDEDLTTTLPLFPMDDETGAGGEDEGKKTRVSPLVVPIIFPTLDKFDLQIVKEKNNNGFSLSGVSYTKKDIMEKIEQMLNFIQDAEKEIAQADKNEKKEEIKKTKKNINTAERRIVEYRNFITDGCNFYPLKIKIRAAFASEGRSTNFKRDYDPLDFEFTDKKIFKIRTDNDVDIEDVYENCIIISASTANYKLTVKGFGKLGEEDIFLKPEIVN